MKIKLDIECTPEEARAFLGLPDLTPVHDIYIERMQSLVRDGLKGEDIEKMMRSWMPLMEGGYDAWSRAMAAMTRGVDTAKP